MAEIKYADIHAMHSDVKGLFDGRDYQGIRRIVEESGQTLAKIAKHPQLFAGYIDEQLGPYIQKAKDTGYPPMVLEAIRALGQRANVSRFDYELGIGRSQDALRKKHGSKETGLEIDLEDAKENLAGAKVNYDTKLAEYGGEANVFPRQRGGRFVRWYRAWDAVDDWRHEKWHKRDMLADLEREIKNYEGSISGIEAEIARERKVIESLTPEFELFKMYVASVAAIEIPNLAKAMQSA